MADRIEIKEPQRDSVACKKSAARLRIRSMKFHGYLISAFERAQRPTNYRLYTHAIKRSRGWDRSSLRVIGSRVRFREVDSL